MTRTNGTTAMPTVGKVADPDEVWADGEARARCDRCKRQADDVFWSRTRSKIVALCPGCVADLRNRGDEVQMMAVVEPG